MVAIAIIKEILEKQEERVKNFVDLELSKADIEWIRDELKNYPHVHRIKWAVNEKILKENKQLKVELDKQLINNRIRTSQFMIDLSDMELDQSLLKWLEIKFENNIHICGVIWGDNNEKLFKNNKKQTEKFDQLLWSNNVDFEKFPTDYIHCLMSSHCQNKDESTWAKLKNKKWHIVEESKYIINTMEKKETEEHEFSAKLYQNDARRQLVLAFRGVKLESRKIFSKTFADNLNNDISIHTYYVYQYTIEAFNLSTKLGYTLSLTGYAFGAWLAEQGAFFCYKKFGSLNVRAVTFESPGSFEIIQKLAKTNKIEQNSQDNLNLSALDIRTYVLTPNFINTSNQHIGKVYRLFERNFYDKYLKSIDEFIHDKMIASIENKKIKAKFEKWYQNARTSFFSKCLFYLNGLTSLMTDHINWIVNFFESEATGDKIFEVISWPKLDIDLKKGQLNDCNPNFIEKLLNWFQFVPKSARNTVSKLPDAILNNALKSIGATYFPSISLFTKILSEIVNGNIRADQCMECFSEGPLEMKETDATDESSFRIAYNTKYEIKKIDLFKDTLTLNLSHVDKRLDDIYCDYDCNYVSSRIGKHFENLKNSFDICKQWNQNELVGHIESRNGEFVIDSIREICKRLIEIDLFYPKNKKLMEKKEHEIIDYFGGIRMESYIKTDPNIFETIDGMLEKSSYVYIYGDSGDGKTALARQYGYYKKDTSPTTLIQFVVSSDYNSNLYSLQKLFNCLDVNTDALGAVKSKALSLNKHILFIFDDVEKLEDVRELLNHFNYEKFQFLLTTTNEKLFQKEDPQKKNGHRIKLFDWNCCFEYLKNNKIELKSDEEISQWKELLREASKASDNTIAPKDFELAVLYYTNRDSFEYNKLLKILINKGNSRYEWLSNENKSAYDILVHLAYLNGTFISLNTIKRLFADIKVEEPLEYLVARGYLKRLTEGNKVLFEMHRSVQDEIKKYLEPYVDVKNNIITRINYILNNAIPKEADDLKDEDREKLDELNKHSHKLSNEVWKDRKKDKNYLEFLSKIVVVNNLIILNYDFSQKIENKILKIKKSLKESEEKQFSIASSYYQLAEISKIKEEYKEALKNFLEAYDTLINCHLPLDDPSILSTMNSIGSVLRKLGENVKSVNYFKTVRDVLRKTLPENHPQIAEAYNNIGLVYKSSQNYEDALRIFFKSLKMREISLPSDHKDILESKINIGITYNAIEKYQDALQYFKDCVKTIDKDSLKSNYEQIDRSVNYIGLIYKKQGKHDKALNAYKKLLEIRKEKYSENHYKVAESMIKIGFLFYKQGKYDESLEYLRNSLNILKETMQFSVDLVKLYKYIGHVYYVQGKYQTALDAYKKALDISKDAYKNPNHPSLAILSRNIQIIESKI